MLIEMCCFWKNFANRCIFMAFFKSFYYSFKKSTKSDALRFVMLIDFSVENFRSFSSRVTLSMESVRAFKEEAKNVVEVKEGLRLLRSATVYGANSSGKTNLVLAMLHMKGIVLSSSKHSSVDKFKVDPCLLLEGDEERPSLFEVRVVIDDFIYRYGFQVTRDAVIAEWLLRSSGVRGKEFIVFTREGQTVSIGESFPELKEVNFGELLRNVLCLSFLDNRNNAIARGVVGKFSNIAMFSGIIEESYQGQTLSDVMNSPTKKKAILGLLKLTDASIVDVGMRPMPAKMLEMLTPEAIKEARGMTVGDIFIRRQLTSRDGTPRIVEFSLLANESTGTQKMFNLATPWLKSLALGRVVFVDELDASLHPLLTRHLVQLFNTPAFNPKNAQLVFVTHDTNLLTHGGFRRDQIWLCEKRGDGTSDLYSLAEISGVRKNDKIERNYLRGKYGAIPFLGGIDSFEEYQAT